MFFKLEIFIRFKKHFLNAKINKKSGKAINVDWTSRTQIYPKMCSYSHEIKKLNIQNFSCVPTALLSATMLAIKMVSTQIKTKKTTNVTVGYFWICFCPLIWLINRHNLLPRTERKRQWKMDENTTKNLRFQMPSKVTEMSIAHALTAIFVTAAAVAAILFRRKVLTTINAVLSTVVHRLRPPLPHHRLQLRMTVECEQGKFCA